MSTILVIEDSDGQRAEVCAALKASGLFDRVIEADDGIEGLKLLFSASPDIVLCDLEMPGLDGEKLLRMRHGVRDSTSEVPFIVLTAVTDLARRARLLEDGASDTITKPFHTADLIARVALHLKLVQARRELLEKNEELERLSRTDALTGLANRRHIDELLAVEFRRSRRYQTPFAIAMADIDFFKSVNDKHGHPVGDAVIARVAETLRKTLRESDSGGRFGGEEFVAILSHNDCAGAQVFAERWRQAVEDTKVGLENGETVSVTISIGVVCWDESFDSPLSMVRCADEALYQAKASGRNRVCLYSGSEGHSEVEGGKEDVAASFNS